MFTPRFLRTTISLLLFLVYISLSAAKSDEGINIAPDANQILTSYVSPWEDLYAINNGYDPQHSGDDSMGAYGNWDGSDGQWHWVEYRWEEPHMIYQSDIYWWTDGYGIHIPVETYQEYWCMDEGEWTLLPGAEGNGTERDQYNVTTFDPVITNRIRVNMVSEASTGILEWRVWAYPEIFPVNTSASIDYDLEPGKTSEVSIISLDTYGNPAEGYVFLLKADITDYNNANVEVYVINGISVMGPGKYIELDPVDQNGHLSFTVEMPDAVDPGDGITLTLKAMEEFPVPGIMFSYTEGGVTPLSGNLVINEFMASNATSNADEDGDHEDWIELYNKGDQPYNLKGVGISDDYERPFRWVLPEVNIRPGEFLVVWASGKDRNDPHSPLHTNFRINKEGEELLLTLPDGERIEDISPVPVPTDISYGRFPDGEDSFVFFNKPTPGAPNSSSNYHGILDIVNFSHEAGFFEDTILLELSHPDPEVNIYYTLDGSAPDTTSLLYTSPVSLGYRSVEENSHSMIPTNYMSGAWGWSPPLEKVAKASIVRAVAVKPGYIDSPARTASYFVFPEGDNRYSLDVVSVVAGHEYLFSDSVGLYVPGDHYITGNHGTGNYYQRGREWEHPASVEFLCRDLYFQQDIGLRIHGGWSRRLAQKNLRLYARNDYGENRFYHKVFPSLPYASYNRLILRAGGNETDFSMFRDPVAQLLASHLDIDTQAYHPFIVFVNGEYWGIKNLRERFDQHYLERVYGVDPDNIDYLTLEYGNMRAKEGDRMHFEQMIDYLSENDLSDDGAFAGVHTMMDINNFMDYYSSQIYFANDDWPFNNIDFWRVRTDYDSTAAKGHDGRWRWLLYDIDRTLNYHTNHNFNMISFLTSRLHPYTNNELPNIILYNLLDNEGFRNDFINRIANHLNTAFSPARVSEMIDSIHGRIEPEMDEHIRRWSNPSSRDAWDNTVNKMYTFAEHRPASVRRHIRDHFGFDGTAELQVNVDRPNTGHLRIEGMDILPSTKGVDNNPYPWSGTYFIGLPLKLEALPVIGYEFVQWTDAHTGDVISTEKVLKISPSDNMSIVAHFSPGDIHAISYWFFGTDIPNNTPLTSVEPVFSINQGAGLSFASALEGYPYDPEHEYWRNGSMERRNMPTGINYIPELNHNISFEDSDMRGLQIRQPLEHQGRESELQFSLPTTGFTNISFRFAAKEEGAAEGLIVEYSINGGAGWTKPEMGNTGLSEEYRLFEVNLSDVQEADNNPDLLIRIRFEGKQTGGFDDNRVTFNNFSLHGEDITLTGGAVPDGDNDIIIFPNPARDHLGIRFNKMFQDRAEVSLMNITGQIVRETTVEKGFGAARIDLNGLKPGIYLVRIRIGNMVTGKKVIVR